MTETETRMPVTDNEMRQSLCLMKYHWFSVLSEAAEMSQKAWGQNKELFSKFSSFGARRGKSFPNDDSRSSKPSFGLCDLRTFLHLVNGPEARAKFLRNISKSFPLQPNNIFIRYQNMNKEYPVPAYASALPHQFETLNDRLMELHAL